MLFYTYNITFEYKWKNGEKSLRKFNYTHEKSSILIKGSGKYEIEVITATPYKELQGVAVQKNLVSILLA